MATRAVMDVEDERCLPIIPPEDMRGGDLLSEDDDEDEDEEHSKITSLVTRLVTRLSTLLA